MKEAHVRDILRILCRAPVTRGYLAIFYYALHSEEGASSAKVKQALDFKQDQYVGLTAGLTNRINNTKRETLQYEKPGIEFIFHLNWTGERMIYKARDEFREALKMLLLLPSQIYFRDVSQEL